MASVIPVFLFSIKINVKKKKKQQPIKVMVNFLKRLLSSRVKKKKKSLLLIYFLRRAKRKANKTDFNKLSYSFVLSLILTSPLTKHLLNWGQNILVI